MRIDEVPPKAKLFAIRTELTSRLDHYLIMIKM